MNICNHIIREDQIAGIGPLMMQQSSDHTIRMLYNSRQLWFYLHLKNHSVKIESDWIDLGDGSLEENKKQRGLYNDFTKQYKEAEEKILSIVRMCEENYEDLSDENKEEMRRHVPR